MNTIDNIKGINIQIEKRDKNSNAIFPLECNITIVFDDCTVGKQKVDGLTFEQLFSTLAETFKLAREENHSTETTVVGFT